MLVTRQGPEDHRAFCVRAIRRMGDARSEPSRALSISGSSARSRRAYLRLAPVEPEPGMACWPPWVCLVSLSPGRVVDDLAGAFAPPPLLSDDVLRLEAPAPVVPPVLEESMLDPVLDAPAPCANAEGGNARAATSPARTS